jgi:hypothetical protein
VNYKINSKGEKENFSREEIVDRLQNGTGINMDHEEYLSSIANSVGAQGKDTWLPYIPESETGMMDKILSHSYLETTEFSPSTIAVSGVNTEKHLAPFPGGRSNYPGEQLLALLNQYTKRLQYFEQIDYQRMVLMKALMLLNKNNLRLKEHFYHIQ